MLGRAVNGFDTPLMSLLVKVSTQPSSWHLQQWGGKGDRGGEVARSLAPTVVHP